MKRALARQRAEAESVANSALAEIVAEEMAQARNGVDPESAVAVETPLTGGRAGRLSFGKVGLAAVAAEDGVGYGYDQGSGNSSDSGDDTPEPTPHRKAREPLSAEREPSDEKPENGDEVRAAQRSAKSKGRMSISGKQGQEFGAGPLSLPVDSKVEPSGAISKGSGNGISVVHPHQRAFDASPGSVTKVIASAGSPLPTAQLVNKEFIPTSKFVGAKEGYIFKAGSKAGPHQICIIEGIFVLYTMRKQCHDTLLAYT